MPKSIQWMAPLFAALSLLLLFGGTLVWFLVLERDARHWVDHTTRVRQSFMDTRALALNTEVAKRNYVISGNPADFLRYQSLVTMMPARLEELSDLTTDNPRQQGRLAQIRALVAEQISPTTAAVMLRKQGDAKGAMALLASAAEHAKFDRRVAIAEEFLKEEIALDKQRQNHATLIERGTITVLAASAVVLLLTTILATRDRRRRINMLEEVNQRLESDNARRQVVERELALLAEHATDAVFRLSLDGRFLYASPSVGEIIGVSPDDLVGRSLFTHLHPEDEASVFTALHRLRIGERDKITISYRTTLRRTPEEWTWLEASSAVIRDDYGMPLEIISSVRNISRRKQLEFELRDARKAAESAATAKSTFLANMSHEIRTPMNGIVGFADLLRATPLSEEQQRYVGMIADSSDAMTGLLNDILDFSKVEAKQMVLAREPFDLHQTLQACITLVTPVIAKKGLGIAFERADDLPRVVEGDALRLRQIVLNLLGNAAKFTQEGGVTLRARIEGGKIVIAVEDSGVGIPMGRQKAIFDPFVQAEAGTSAAFGGTGLGLPISAQLAGLMGGRLDLFSTPGSGTTVTLRIPLQVVDQAEAQQVIAKAAPVAAESTGLRVLVAEDHDVNQMLILSMLRQLGCIVDLVPDGASAVERASDAEEQGTPYALLFMDLHMPGMDGHEACREIRARGIDGKTLPIVALTANAYADDVEASYAAGMQDHIAKPFKLDDLRQALQRWANRQGKVAEPVVIEAEAEPEPAAAAPSIKDRYRARKIQTLERLEEAAQLAETDAAALGDAIMTELAELLHKLAGTAGMFGEAALGDQARALEEMLLAQEGESRTKALLDAMPALRAAA